jgi:hypothetical protein
LIEKAVNLKVVGRAGNGIDNIDVDACTRRVLSQLIPQKPILWPQVNWQSAWLLPHSEIYVLPMRQPA